MDLARLQAHVRARSEQYAVENAIVRDPAWFLLKLQEEVGELVQVYLMRAGQARDKGLSSEELDDRFRLELSDVLCQVLLIADEHGVDCEAEVVARYRSWGYDFGPDDPAVAMVT
ncbi:pyrophosphatase [Rhodococcus sp. ABRD24]|uniref:pyrophosphatase n=1 Tax=Rhodococcus sp. ABRD24 TaxID=2507582 RepID=UPI00103C60D0|nr:pyrophosphatase [Rhodococcus sp. ABRD24]QBJ97222.1 pyrophosphatase [Rhodococcus sp. ABRD24]